MYRSLSQLSIRVLAVSALLATHACTNPEQVSSAKRAVIADSLESLVKSAYDFSKLDATARLLSLYPDSGRVISAAAGRVTATREALSAQIGGFWERVGRNMQSPKFVLGSSYVDVITPNAAVMTFAYKIPHTTPMGQPHTVAGAWTTLWRNQNGRWMIVQEHLSDTPESTMSPAVDSTATHVMPPAHGPDTTGAHKHPL